MDNSNATKSLFVRIFEIIIHAILQCRIFVLIAITLLTLFFLNAVRTLQIDANIFGFTAGVPPAEHIATPSALPEGEKVFYALPEDYVKFIPEEFRYQERPADQKLDIDIPDSMRNGTTYNGYPDGFVIIFSSAELYTPTVLNLLSDVMAELETLDKVGPCLSPFDFVTVE